MKQRHVLSMVLISALLCACGGPDEGEDVEQTEDELNRITIGDTEPIGGGSEEIPDLEGGDECVPGEPGCFCTTYCDFKAECRVRCALCAGSCNTYNGPSLNKVARPDLTPAGNVPIAAITDSMSIALPGALIELEARSISGDGARTFSAIVHDTFGSRSFCAGGADVIPVGGAWDVREGVSGGGAKVEDGSTTLACRGSAIAKCVEAGYAPWSNEASNQAHQACVRALRADFCGDGRSWTTEGVAIELAPRAHVSSRVLEAEWSANGAVSIAAPRGASPRCDSVAEGSPSITTRLR